METKILEMVLGQIPEAIYFSLFMIFSKQLKEKRVLFVSLMTIEYLIIQKLIHFDIWLQIIYTAFVFVILKLLYKEKAQITDIFTFTISSIILIILDLILYFTIGKLTNNYILFAVIDKMALLYLVFLIRNKLPKIQTIYKKLWNRNDSKKKKIKTTTFRSLNVVIFNITFYIINLVMLYCIYYNSLN
jgi:hypothetical protein